MLNTPDLALAYCEIIADLLTPEQLAEVRRRNAEEPNPHVCHSADFCDINQAMTDALGSLGFGDKISNNKQRIIDAARLRARQVGYDASQLEAKPVVGERPGDGEFVFQRLDNRPLACTGRVLAYATSRRDKGFLLGKWHDLKLIETNTGKLVLAIEYHTTREGEQGHGHAEVVPSLESVPPALEKYDPVARIASFPDQPAFAYRQRQLVQQIREGYQWACGKLMAEAGIVERV